jgi:hypothetical protein
VKVLCVVCDDADDDLLEAPLVFFAGIEISRQKPSKVEAFGGLGVVKDLERYARVIIGVWARRVRWPNGGGEVWIAPEKSDRRLGVRRREGRSGREGGGG